MPVPVPPSPVPETTTLTTVNPFTRAYRAAVRADLRVAGGGTVAAHDERPRRAPFVVVTKRACGAARERCVLVPRGDDCGPTRFAVRAYLGHGASGAVFAVVADDGAPLAAGTRVEARYRRGDAWFPGTVQSAADAGGVFAVTYDDGDVEDAVARVDARPLAPVVALKVARGAAADDLATEAALAATARARAPLRAAALGTLVDPLATWRWRDAAALAAPRLGPSLSDVLRRGAGCPGARPPESLALFLAAGVIEAVLACHEGGVLHCDVKPENLLLRAPAGADNDDDDDAADNRDAALAAARRGHGLVLADFGRAIDRRRHDAGVRFATARDHAHLVAYEWPPARADRRCGPSARASWTVELTRTRWACASTKSRWATSPRATGVGAARWHARGTAASGRRCLTPTSAQTPTPARRASPSATRWSPPPAPRSAPAVSTTSKRSCVAGAAARRPGRDTIVNLR